MRVFIALILSLAAVAAFPKNPQRIVGGSVTNINSYPEMASLLYSPGTSGHRQSCGGTIINNRSILTAAQCTFGDVPSSWLSRVGSSNANSGGTVIATASIINHPDFNRLTFDNDLAILRTANGIVFSPNVQPGSIAGENFIVADNQHVWAAGWGSITPGGPHSTQLRHVQIWTVNQETCRQSYLNIGFSVTDNMLCSGWLNIGGRGQCDGDWGGPLFYNKVVIGVSSFGLSCALPTFHRINVRVSRYVSWIQTNA